MEKTGNSKKTKKILIPVVILLVLAILGGSAYLVYRLCFARHAKNVFEEIYYMQTSEKNEMPEGFALDRDDIFGFKSWTGPWDNKYCLSFYYKKHDGIFKWTEIVYTYCYKAPNKRIEFTRHYLSNPYSNGPDTKVIYNLKNRTLTVEGTNSTDASFIFETLLPAWFEGMGDRSSYSMENLGVFTDLTGR